MKATSEEGAEKLKVEVLELKPDGNARVRLWYYKWRETRPRRPHADVVFRPRKPGRPYVGKLVAGKGITFEHLADIVSLLGYMGVRGVYLRNYVLYFTPKFLYTAVAELGAPVEPARVEYLGGFEFSVDGRAVWFHRQFIASQEAVRGYKYSLQVGPVGEALYLFARLRAAGVWAEVRRTEVYLGVDALVGFMTATGALPPGFGQLYVSEDLRIYDEVSGHYYFAVRLGGVWRVAWGKFSGRRVNLKSKSPEVAEAAWRRVVEFLRQLGAPDDVRPPGRLAKTYAFTLHLRHLAPILRFAGVAPAEVAANSGKVRIRAGDAEAEFAPGEQLVPLDPQKAHGLHKALMALGIPTAVEQGGLRIPETSALALLALASGGAEPPKEVAPGAVLVYRHASGERALYALLFGYDILCFAAKTAGMWKTRCGTLNGNVVYLSDDGTLAEIISGIYRRMGKRRTPCRKKGTIMLTSVDMKLLGMWETLLKARLDWLQRRLSDGL